MISEWSLVCDLNTKPLYYFDIVYGVCSPRNRVCVSVQVEIRENGDEALKNSRV